MKLITNTYHDVTTHTVVWEKTWPTHEVLVTSVVSNGNEDDTYYLVTVACIDTSGNPLIGKHQVGRYVNCETAIRQAKMMVELIGWGRVLSERPTVR